MSNTHRQAEKSSQWAEKDLVRAKQWVDVSDSPNAKREARRMAKDAKRRRSRARRRAWRAESREFDS